MARFMQNAAGDYYTPRIFDGEVTGASFATYTISERGATCLFEIGLNIGDEIPWETYYSLQNSGEIYPSGSSPLTKDEVVVQNRANAAVASFFKRLDDVTEFPPHEELFRRDVVPKLARITNPAMRYQMFLDVALRLHDRLDTHQGWSRREIVDLADTLKRHAPAAVQRELESRFPPDMPL